VLRHVRNKRTNIHVCAPILDSDDFLRSMSQVGWDDMCRHKAEECTCVTHASALSVDSLYYLEPQQIAQVIAKTTANCLVAVLHLFRDAYGSFASGEATYSFINEKDLVMHVKGNLKPYVHSAMTWLLDSTAMSVVVGGEVKTLCWSQIGHTADHSILRFALTSVRVPRRVSSLPFEQAVCENGYYGSVYSGPLSEPSDVNVTGQLVQVDYARSVSMGSWFLFYWISEKRHVVVPKGLIGQLRREIVGQRRNADCFRQLVHHARHFSKPINLPPGHMADVLFMCAALAHAADVEWENQVAHAVLAPKARAMKIHEEMLDFKFQPVLRTPSLVSVAVGAASGAAAGAGAASTVNTVLAGATAIAAKGAAVVGLAVGAAPVLPVAAVALGGALVGAAASAYVSSRREPPPQDPFQAYEDDMYHRRSNGPSMLSAPIGEIRWLPATLPTTPLSDLLGRGLGWACTLRCPDPEAIGKRPNYIAVVGVVQTQAIPVVVTNNAHAALAAVVERQCAPTLKDELGLDEELKEWKTTHGVARAMSLFDVVRERVFGRKFTYTQATYSDWARRYAESKRRVYDVARSRLNDGRVSADITHLVRFFTKVELLSESNEHGMEKLIPRGISGGVDEDAVLTGPIVDGLSLAMSEQLDGIRVPILYVTKTNCLVPGAHYGAAIRRGLTSCMLSDASRYDASLHAELLVWYNFILEWLGVPPDFLERKLRDIKVKAINKFLKWKSFGRALSGRFDTTFRNTILSVALLLSVLMEYKGATPETAKSVLEDIFKNVFIFVGGDDLCVLFTPGYITHDLADLFKAKGIKIKPKYYTGPKGYEHAEFFRSRFYLDPAAGICRKADLRCRRVKGRIEK
jgi:hypothetical protein